MFILDSKPDDIENLQSSPPHRESLLYRKQK